LRVSLTALSIVVATAAALLAQPAAGEPVRWQVDPARSAIVVHVDAAGLLSPLLKDHHFTPDAWTGSLQFDPGAPGAVAVEVSITADSLRNLQDELSPEDRATVARQVRSPSILHVERYPEIRFRADRLDIGELTGGAASGSLRGTLRGELTIRDRSRPLEVGVDARWSEHTLRATGQATFRQTEFGIEPYRRFLGTVAVADVLRLEVDVEAVRVQ
jgi:polyisoprenoid-binding protein YceI